MTQATDDQVLTGPTNLQRPARDLLVTISGSQAPVKLGVALAMSGGGAQPSTVLPLMDGAAAIGTNLEYALADHVHPIDTSRASIVSPAFTGTPTTTTPLSTDNSTALATTAFVATAVSASVTSFNTRTGAVTLTSSDVTAAGGALTSSIPVAYTSTPAMDGTGGPGASGNYSRGDHIHPSDTSRAPLAAPSFTGVVTLGPTTIDTSTGVFQFTNTTGPKLNLYLTQYGLAVNSGELTGFTNGNFCVRTGGWNGTIISTTTPTGLNATAVGATTPASGAFTSLTASGAVALASATSVTVPTVAAGTNNTTAASTAFVQAAVAGGTAGVASFNSRTGIVTLSTADVTGAGGAPAASPTLTGTVTMSGATAVTVPTATAGTNNTTAASTAFVASAIAAGGSGVSSFNTRTGAVTLSGSDLTGAGGALLASPTFTGTPAAPTATAGTNTTQIATTAFVAGAVPAASSTTPLVNGTAAIGTSATYARADHVHPTDTTRAPAASPTFTGTPAAPTPAVGTNTTQVATTAFVISEFATPPALGSTTPAGVSMTSQNGDQLAGFRNYLINGAFDTWQRGTSFTTPATGAYLSDRWLTTYDGSGSVSTISQQPVSAQAPWDTGLTSVLRYAVTTAGSGGTVRQLAQRIENVRTFGGKTVTISAWLVATAAVSVTVNLSQVFGTGGSPSATVTQTAQTFAVTTVFTRFSATFTLPTTFGKVFGTNNDHYLAVLFGLPINATCQIDITGVQIEAGPVGTPFEWRSIGAETALCNRYYELGQIYMAGNTAASAVVTASMAAKAPLRTNPTMTITTNACTNITSPSVSGNTLALTVSGTVTAAGGYQLNVVHATACEL